jgi:hypothetical protein
MKELGRSRSRLRGRTDGYVRGARIAFAYRSTCTFSTKAPNAWRPVSGRSPYWGTPFFIVSEGTAESGRREVGRSRPWSWFAASGSLCPRRPRRLRRSSDLQSGGGTQFRDSRRVAASPESGGGRRGAHGIAPRHVRWVYFVATPKRWCPGWSLGRARRVCVSTLGMRPYIASRSGLEVENAIRVSFPRAFRVPGPGARKSAGCSARHSSYLHDDQAQVHAANSRRQREEDDRDQGRGLIRPSRKPYGTSPRTTRAAPAWDTLHPARTCARRREPRRTCRGPLRLAGYRCVYRVLGSSIARGAASLAMVDVRSPWIAGRGGSWADEAETLAGTRWVVTKTRWC